MKNNEPVSQFKQNDLLFHYVDYKYDKEATSNHRSKIKQ